MRKLVTLRPVTEIRAIKGADNIELAILDGWQCVVKRNEFKVGDTGLYFEIDSWLDHTKPQFAFLAPRAVKWDGKEGVRIKSMKLKGELSQGLLLPVADFPEVIAIVAAAADPFKGVDVESLNEAHDFAEILGVEKWERQLAANLAGRAKGNFPTFIPKTDQERVQNLPRLFQEYGDDVFQITKKLDGSSLTAYFVTNESRYYQEKTETIDEQVIVDNTTPNIGVCSRNLDLVDTEGNAFWEQYHRENMGDKMARIATSLGLVAIAVQGELVGQGIQKNHEKVEGPNEFYVYDIFDIEAQKYLSPEITSFISKSVGFQHVPVVHPMIVLSQYAKDRAEILQKAVGPSIRQPIGEGEVYKLISAVNGFSFKAISDVYLLKTDN